ncbi:MAG: YhjD/YihY/BrkB family envelope integrity protein [Pirellulaceae bacterium]
MRSLNGKMYWWGASITMLLFLLGRWAMQMYFPTLRLSQLGAAAASIAVLLVWVYYTAMIVLLGAEVTQVYAVVMVRVFIPNQRPYGLSKRFAARRRPRWRRRKIV